MLATFRLRTAPHVDIMLERQPPLVPQGRLEAHVLDDVKKATSPDVHHATGGCRGHAHARA
jgi:hypothetical protein